MAKTRRDLTSDGVTVIYDVDFDLGYMRREFVYVYLDGDDYTTQLTYTWVNSTQIQLAAPLAVDTEFHIRRVVPRDELVNDYTDGAILYERNLDDSYTQSLMILEEIDDGYSGVNDDLQVQVDANAARINTNAIDIYDLQNGDVNVPVSVLDVAALRLKEPQYDGQSIDLLGHTIKGVGGGQLYHDVDDTTTADNNMTVFVTPLGARWKRNLGATLTAEMCGAISDGVADDTIALNSGSQLAVYLSKKFILSSAHLVTQWVIPMSLHVEGVSSQLDTEETKRPTKIRQVSGQTIPCVIARNALYEDKTGGIVMKNIRIEGQGNNSTGFHLENLGNCVFDNIIIASFYKGFYINQVHDTEIGLWICLACTHAGEIVNGAEDNTNNLIVNYMVCEAFTESGLTIVGGDEGNGSNNKMCFQRLKIESAELSPTATHAFKMHYAGTMSFLNFDVTIVGNQPDPDFLMMDIERCNSIDFGLIELREQTSTALTTLCNVATTEGLRMTVVSALGVDTVNELVTFDNASCKNIEFLYLQDRNGTGSTPSNLDCVGGLYRPLPNTIANDLRIERNGEIALIFKRGSIDTSYSYGRINVLGELQLYKGGTLVQSIDQIGDFQHRTGNLALSIDGAGILLNTPDGLARYKLSIDNSGNVITTVI